MRLDEVLLLQLSENCLKKKSKPKFLVKNKGNIELCRQQGDKRMSSLLTRSGTV